MEPSKKRWGQFIGIPGDFIECFPGVDADQAIIREGNLAGHALQEPSAHANQAGRLVMAHDSAERPQVPLEEQLPATVIE